jgi:hypothetical protein
VLTLDGSDFAPQGHNSVHNQTGIGVGDDPSVTVKRAKPRFSLGRVMSKLAQTAQTAIAIIFLVLNLEHWLRCLLAFLLGLVALPLVRIEPTDVCQGFLNRISTTSESMSLYPLTGYSSKKGRKRAQKPFLGSLRYSLTR